MCDSRSVRAAGAGFVCSRLRQASTEAFGNFGLLMFDFPVFAKASVSGKPTPRQDAEAVCRPLLSSGLRYLLFVSRGSVASRLHALPAL